MRKASLVEGRRWECHKDFLKPSHYHTLRHSKGASRGGRNYHWADVTLAVKLLKAGETAGCDEI